jgi:hypothetical protein
MTELLDDDTDTTPSTRTAKQRKALPRKYEDEQIKLDVEAIMGTPAGRRYLSHLVEFGGQHRTSFTGNSTTFFNEGLRNFSLKIIADMKQFAPTHYLQLLQDNLRDDT